MLSFASRRLGERWLDKSLADAVASSVPPCLRALGQGVAKTFEIQVVVDVLANCPQPDTELFDGLLPWRGWSRGLFTSVDPRNCSFVEEEDLLKISRLLGTRIEKWGAERGGAGGGTATY